MALSESEQISLVQLAMQKVNVVPYEDNGISFGTNVKCVEISENEVSVCECYIDVAETMFYADCNESEVQKDANKV